MEYKDRLKAARRHAKLTQAGLAKAVGITQTSISDLERGKSVSSSYNASIAKACGISALWLEREEGAMVIDVQNPLSGSDNLDGHSTEPEAVMIGDLSPWDDSTPLDDDEVELPLYKEVELAAGSGRTAVQEMPGRKLRFSYATLRTAGVDPAAAVCAQLKGNSMEPLIMNGATIGIDKATTRVVDGEIYALEHDGMLRVKYLYRLPGGGLRLRSFNRDEYADEEYSSEEMHAKSISIIGWVFWWSTLRSRNAFKR